MIMAVVTICGCIDDESGVSLMRLGKSGAGAWRLRYVNAPSRMNLKAQVTDAELMEEAYMIMVGEIVIRQNMMEERILNMVVSLMSLVGSFVRKDAAVGHDSLGIFTTKAWFSS
ncbi:MAG: hypothetical protein ACLUVG_01485 [Phocaeicola vulgatus]